jgi:hypothetical protein
VRLRCAVTVAGVFAVAASAADAKDLLRARDRDWIVSLDGAVWAESQLPLLGYNIVTGNLKFQDAQLVQIGLSRVLVHDFSIPLPGKYVLNGNSIELQVIGTQHFGLETDQEGVAAVVLRSGDIPLWGDVSVNLAWGNGLSYAFEAPQLEKGPDGTPGVDSRQLQYYMGFESEWTFSRGARWHLTTMLHHRSGIYGVISPQHTGSNYMGAGINFDF